MAAELMERGALESISPATVWRIYLSIVQPKVVNPNDFTDLDQITARLGAFEARYNTLGEPFEWTFGRDAHPRSSPRLRLRTLPRRRHRRYRPTDS
ncbi:MAG: hypothetical protein ACRD0J_00265 [Acidimicrobiales bacterium]